jgi:hypothetical protein
LATNQPEWRQTAVRLIAACGLAFLGGCGGLKLVPVSGKVMLGDQPLTIGRVSFIPDGSKGNKAAVACVGHLDSKGQYELHTTGVKASERGKGAPLGWYKVTLLNTIGSPTLDGKVDRKYFDENKTPLSVEVVEDPSPGHYDFKVAK